MVWTGEREHVNQMVGLRTRATNSKSWPHKKKLLLMMMIIVVKKSGDDASCNNRDDS
jgi:hypothetical protein